MKEKLMNNLGLKVLSVIAAVLLWLVVVNIDDPVRTETYSGIRVTMLNESAITGKGKVYKIEDESNIISVSVSAKRSVHKKLTSADFVATADMEKDIQYDNLVAINVTCNNRNVVPSDIKKSRSNVKVSIEDSATEEFNVVVKQKGTPGSGFIVGDMIPEQRVISVTGPASLVERIKRIEAEADVTGRTGDDTIICNLTVCNNEGNPLDTTYLKFNGKTEGMAVKVTLLKIKEVPLEFEVSGTPANGYGYIGKSFKPELVEIAGVPSDLSGINKIQIPAEALNIEGFTSSTKIEVDIRPYLPERIRLVDEAAGGVVVVSVEIEKMQTKEVVIPISRVSLKGVPKGYSVSFGELESVTIPVMALKADLDILDSDDIAVTLDVSGVTEAGDYTRSLEIHIPGDYEVNRSVEIPFELMKGNAGQGNTEEPDDETDKGEDSGSSEGNTPGENNDSTTGDGTSDGVTGDAAGGSSAGGTGESTGDGQREENKTPETEGGSTGV